MIVQTRFCPSVATIVPPSADGQPVPVIPVKVYPLTSVSFSAIGVLAITNVVAPDSTVVPPIVRKKSLGAALPLLLLITFLISMI